MKADLDRLMGEYNLDAFVVMGDEAPNPCRDYLTNRAKAGGMVIRKRSGETVYVVNAMEIDEAAKSGLKVLTHYDFGMGELVKEHGKDLRLVRRELFFNYFRKLGIQGRVAFFGTGDINAALESILDLQDSGLEIEIVVGGDAAKLFGQAYTTKDAAEIAAIRDTAVRACQVVRRTWDFIAGHHAERDEIGVPVIGADGQPLTIGAVKRFIQAQELALGLENPDGPIFAQGRDAGVPHSHGEDADVIQVGRAIVFDYFPRGLANGYFHDMTRTWCVGCAPAEVQTVYDEVIDIFRQAVSALQAGEPTNKYQIMTLDFFEARGHKTQRSHPGTMEGYVHSLGHGVGLNVHESPSFRERSDDQVTPGNVITIEPGLYYPDRGFGVRIEDMIYIDEIGRPENLTDFPYDLILPLRG